MGISVFKYQTRKALSQKTEAHSKYHLASVGHLYLKKKKKKKVPKSRYMKIETMSEVSIFRLPVKGPSTFSQEFSRNWIGCSECK